MKTSSCKAKGRRACQDVKDLLHKYAPDLRPGDIEITSSGACGEDLKLSPAARELYPFNIECKNTEAINIWKAFQQAESHVEDYMTKVNFDNGATARFTETTKPILFFKRNRSELMVCLKAEDFIKLIR